VKGKGNPSVPDIRASDPRRTCREMSRFVKNAAARKARARRRARETTNPPAPAGVGTATMGAA